MTISVQDQKAIKDGAARFMDLAAGLRKAAAELRAAHPRPGEDPRFFEAQSLKEGWYLGVGRVAMALEKFSLQSVELGRALIGVADETAQTEDRAVQRAAQYGKAADGYLNSYLDLPKSRRPAAKPTHTNQESTQPKRSAKSKG